MSVDVDVEIPMGQRALTLAFKTTHQVTGIFGPSGCGKTSLLEFICGLRRGHGVLRVGGEVWQDDRRFVATHHRRIGYVPQGARLFPHRDVRDNLLAGGRRATRAGQDPEKMLRRVVELLELGEILSCRVGTLSGGEAQRVALGRALCSAPQLLLLDEPLAALDHALKYRILYFLRRVREEYQIPTLLVSHDPTEVQLLCHDLLVIGDGGLRARGEPSATLADPAALEGAATGEIQSVLECALIEVGSAGCTVQVGATQLKCLPTSGAMGDSKLLVLRARDIIVAAARPVGLSARNILAARIEGVEPSVEGRLLGLRLDAPHGPLIRAVISVDAFQGMGLEDGGEVFAIIKASCCTLLPFGATSD
jgi:molybdate transport system ATP-binding protein